MADHPRVVVHPVSPSGGRRVTAHVHGVDMILGVAYGPKDLVEFLRRAGLHPDEVDLAGAEYITWRRDGPSVWENPPPL